MWERLQFEKRFHFLDPGKVMSPVQPVLPLCKSKQTSYFKNRSMDLTLITFETFVQLQNPLAILNVLWIGTFGSSLSFLLVISLSLSYFASKTTVQWCVGTAHSHAFIVISFIIITYIKCIIQIIISRQQTRVHLVVPFEIKCCWIEGR